MGFTMSYLLGKYTMKKAWIEAGMKRELGSLYSKFAVQIDGLIDDHLINQKIVLPYNPLNIDLDGVFNKSIRKYDAQFNVVCQFVPFI